MVQQVKMFKHSRLGSRREKEIQVETEVQTKPPCVECG